MKKLVLLLLIVCVGCQSASNARLVRVKEYPHSKRFIIAITDFENTSGDPSNDKYIEGLSDILIQELISYGRFRIVERERLHRVLDELDLELAGLVTSEKRKEVGQVLGADALLFAGLKSVTSDDEKTSAVIAYRMKRRTDVQLWARLVHAETGEILSSSTANAYLKQTRSVAFGVVKSGEFTEEEIAIQRAIGVAIKQLANDIAASTPAKE
jgi:curli biogenesis system outer membrane secretion channel CsgG